MATSLPHEESPLQPLGPIPEGPISTNGIAILQSETEPPSNDIPLTSTGLPEEPEIPLVSQEPQPDEEDPELALPEAIEIIQHPFSIDTEDAADGVATINLWCLDRQSRPSLLRVRDFYPFCYIRLPPVVSGHPTSWDMGTAMLVVEFLNRCLDSDHPVDWSFELRAPIYYYQGDRKIPTLKVSFLTLSALQHCQNLLNRPRNIPGIGTAKFEVLESQISIVRKLTTMKNLRYAQWFKVMGHPIPVGHELRISKSGRSDRPIAEYIAEWNTIVPISHEESKDWTTSPKILGFDLETHSDNHKAMPNPYNAKHVITLNSCIGKNLKDGTVERHLFVLGDCDPIPNATLHIVNDELEMVDQMAQLVNDYDPDIITGFNIFGYDYFYLDVRIKTRMREWPNMGRLINRTPKMYSKSWRSGGYGVNTINSLEMDGRISCDMLPIVRRDYKLDKYSLEFVSQTFLKKGKHDVKPELMFTIYEELVAATEEEKKVQECEGTYRACFADDASLDDETKANFEATIKQYEATHARFAKAKTMMKRFGEYCLQDSILCIELFEKLNTWIGLVELSSIVGVTIFELFTRGQQIRCQSQIYNLSAQDGFVINKREAPKMFFNGGFVFEPKPGLRRNVICEDFASLYPSIIMAYNIDYTTLVSPEMDSQIPDEMCNVIEFDQEETPDGKPKKRGSATADDEGPLDGAAPEEESDSEDETSEKKKTVTRHYRFKFVKREVREGILPRLVRNLVDERGLVKKQIKKLELEKKNLVYLETALKAHPDDLPGTLAALQLEEKDPDKELRRKFAITMLTEGYPVGAEKHVGTYLEYRNYIAATYPNMITQIVVLDKRQLALKVSANSMFGFLGAQTGGLMPLIEGAMSITAYGRRLIGQVNQYVIDKYGAEIIYGDTDSSMMDLHIVDSAECNRLGQQISDEISGVPEHKLPDGTIVPAVQGLFPPPLHIEFEKAMVILTIKKKKYAFNMINNDGSLVKDKDTGLPIIYKRGIMTARRDNCAFARTTYDALLRSILSQVPIVESLKIITDACAKLLDGTIIPRGNLTIIRELGSEYKNQNYFMKVFADELRRMGKPPNPGDRLEYLIVRTQEEAQGMEVPLGRKMRSIEMWEEAQGAAAGHVEKTDDEKVFDIEVKSEVSNYPPEDIDALYYIEHTLMNPLDQIFEIGYQEELRKYTAIGYKPQNSRCHPAYITTPVKMIGKMVTDLLKGAEADPSPEKVKLAQIAQIVRMIPEWFDGQVKQLTATPASAPVSTPAPVATPRRRFRII